MSGKLPSAIKQGMLILDKGRVARSLYEFSEEVEAP